LGTAGGRRTGKLLAAVRVILYHPRWSLSCRTCETYQFDSDGRPVRTPGGEIEERGNLPTPCHKCEKVPQWARRETPEDYKRLRSLAAELTDQQRKAWEFYNRMKAVSWQDPAACDRIVQYFAGSLRQLEDRHARDQADRSAESVGVLLDVIAKRWLKR
jgi:hypothetical protein